MRQLIFILLFINFFSCTLKNQNNSKSHCIIDSSRINGSESYDFKNEILKANKKYKIFDKMALNLLINKKEISELKDWKYNDTIT
jgi:hypothetical protein